MNLGWKLAQVVDGTSPEALLDTYHAERHPVGARVLRHTRAQVALNNPDVQHQAVIDDLAELLAMDEPRRRFAGMLSGSTCTTTSATATRWSGGGCRTSICARRQGADGRRACTSCCTTPDRCCSTSVRSAQPTSHPTSSGCDASTPPPTVRGSCRCSVQSRAGRRADPTRRLRRLGRRARRPRPRRRWPPGAATQTRGVTDDELPSVKVLAEFATTGRLGYVRPISGEAAGQEHAHGASEQGRTAHTAEPSGRRCTTGWPSTAVGRELGREPQRLRGERSQPWVQCACQPK